LHIPTNLNYGGAMKYRLTILTIALLISFSVSNAQGELKLLTSVHGEKNGDIYSMVTSLGDVNGDGYNDFIVGSLIGRGYAKLYFGSPQIDTLNYIRFQNNEPFTSYNGTFTGGGDLNGAGYYSVYSKQNESKKGIYNERDIKIFFINSSGICSGQFIRSMDAYWRTHG
jgi:hypothetical protein